VVIDPHYVPYGNLNLHIEMWDHMQKLESYKSLTESIKGIIEQDLVAVIKNSILEEMAFESIVGTDIASCLVPSYSSSHWCSLGLSILAHAAFEVSKEEGVTRFQKSLYDNEAYLPENIVVVTDTSCRWGKNTLKSMKHKPVVKIQLPIQGSLF
jgi:hypothetical protein